MELDTPYIDAGHLRVASTKVEFCDNKISAPTQCSRLCPNLQDVVFLLDVAATLCNNLSPDVREFLISEEVNVPQILPMETNHQGN